MTQFGGLTLTQCNKYRNKSACPLGVLQLLSTFHTIQWDLLAHQSLLLGCDLFWKRGISVASGQISRLSTLQLISKTVSEPGPAHVPTEPRGRVILQAAGPSAPSNGLPPPHTLHSSTSGGGAWGSLVRCGSYRPSRHPALPGGCAAGIVFHMTPVKDSGSAR